MVERREFCIEYIKNNECSNKGNCLFAHVIIPDEIKDEYIEAFKCVNNGNEMFNNTSTKTEVGKSIISKCITCKRGTFHLKSDYLENKVKVNYCSDCFDKLQL